MNETFDSGVIADNNWRQGAILGTDLALLAFKLAPKTVSVADGDLLVLTSHDCDIVNFSIDKEPVVEVLRATARASTSKIDKQQSWGRNPRQLELATEFEGRQTILSFSVHDRWFIPRQLLHKGAPDSHLPNKERRLIAEWLAKRYIRAAFPTAFDLRWRTQLKFWQKLLSQHSDWIQGIYMRLSTFDELEDNLPYKCHFIAAVPYQQANGDGWVEKRPEIETEIESFWGQFNPHIVCEGVELLSTDEITLADIENYQRFDVDWVSFADDSQSIAIENDMGI